MKNSVPAEGGYFRMPNSWLYLDISPGAKVLLAHFCSAANDTGASWYSYEQLKAVVGRGKSSISAYVSELREAGVIRTREQKMANGYNYRLLITVKGWKDLVQKWSQKRITEPKVAIKKTERSVQQVERKDPSGPITNIHKTNQQPDRFALAAITSIKLDRPTGGVWSIEDEKDWHKFRPSDRDPATVFGQLPCKDLIVKMRNRLEDLKYKAGVIDAPQMIELIDSLTNEFIRTNRITDNSIAQDAFRAAIKESCTSQQQVVGLFKTLNSKWHPSWRKLSTPAQVKVALQDHTAASRSPDQALRSEIGKLSTRLAMYELAKRIEQSRKQKAA